MMPEIPLRWALPRQGLILIMVMLTRPLLPGLVPQLHILHVPWLVLYLPAPMLLMQVLIKLFALLQRLWPATHQQQVTAPGPW